MKRDVKALFGDSSLVHKFKGGKNTDKSLDFNDGVLAVSYSTMSNEWDNKGSNFDKIVNWLGEDFDGVVVFDEAHKMANSGKQGTRGKIKPSEISLSGIELQKRIPKARIVYSSATGATEVENLRYAERLGLWGDGTSFRNSEDFVSKIKAGGLAAMELIARDMKAMGVYLSRNISYDDVEYDRITHKLTKEQRQIYDELAHSWQIVFQNVNNALIETNQIKDGKAKQLAIGGFWGSEQRFFNQILTSMQVPSVIADMEKQLANGNSCVIQLVSTNEAAQKKEFARLKEQGLDLEDFDLTPKEMLMSYIETCFPTIQYEDYTDDNGNVRSRPAKDSKDNLVINREAVKQKEELLNKLGSIKVPSSPLDMIIDHFGTDMVAENTGRSRRVIEKNGKRIEEKISGKKDADVDAFQNGKKRIIIFSKAGGTGKSYHADLSAKNQQHRVHYLLEPGWRADDAVQGFGRSHRSNQASAPTFKLVTTDLKGQMRFVSTIAKRLDQLGALTKGQRQAGGQGMFSASDNLENSFAADVLSYFYKDLVSNKVDGISDGVKIIEKLGLKDKILDEYGRIRNAAPEMREVNKFLNRILSLDSKEQNTVFEGYSVRLEEATERAAQAGTLDRGLENYKADKISVNESKDIRVDEATGAATKYYNLTAQNKVNPVSVSEFPTVSDKFMGYYRNKNTGAIRAVFKSSSRTDQYGNVSENVKMYTQIKQKNGRPKCEYQPAQRLYRSWERIEDTQEALKAWDEAVKNLPEYTTENIHMIGGVVLPVWDKLPMENVRIYRVLTDEGDMLIGRVIPENLIDSTLRRMGASRTKEKVSTPDLIERVKNGNPAILENGWKLKKSRVSNEQRIELVGPTYVDLSDLKDKGVFSERISYQTRFFVPVATDTEKVIDNILKISPLEGFENSEETSYNLGGDNTDVWKGNSTDGEKITADISDEERAENEIVDTAHTPEQLKVMEEYENAVDENMKRFIDRVREGKNKKYEYEIGKTSDRFNSAIYDGLGIDTSGYTHNLAPDAVAHIDNRHGENGKSDKTMSDTEDIQRLGYVLGNYDHLYSTDITSNKYKDKNNNPAPVVVFTKRIDGYYIIAEAVPDSAKKQVHIISTYKNEASEVPHDLLKSLSLTSENELLSTSDKSLSQNDGGVKQSKERTPANWKNDKGGKDSAKDKKSLHDIVSYISKMFEIPISTGNMSSRKAKGEFKVRPNTIRIKIANDLPTVCHELGHMLDDKYGLRKSEYIDDVISFAEKSNPTLMELYAKKDKPGEGIAEFVREYLKNPQNVQENVPEFFNEFEEALDDDDMAAISTLSEYVQDYFNSDFSERVMAATITNSEIRKAEKGTISDKSEAFYRKIVDDYAPINDVIKYVEKATGAESRGEKNAYTLAINSRNSDAVVSFILKEGMADSHGNIVEGKSFIDCLSGIKPKEIKGLDQYLILKHSLEWLEPKDGKAKRVFSDDTLQDVERIKAEIKSIEENHPEYVTAAENLYEYQRNILKLWAVETGGMTEELYNRLQELYPNYVPFNRYVGKGKGKGGVSRAFANQRTPIARAKGSGASIISPIESIMQNVRRFVEFGMRNKVMGVIADYAVNTEGFGQFIEEIPPDKVAHSVGIIPQVERLKEAMSGLDEPDFMALTDALDDIFGDRVVSYTPVAIAGKQIVTYLDKGKYRYFQVHDKALYDSITKLTPKQLNGMMKVATKTLGATNMLITQFNPLFAAKNIVRDFDTALRHSKAYDNPVQFVGAYMAAFKHVLTNSAEYKEYKAAGGGHMSNFSDNIDAIEKALHDIAIKDMGLARRTAYSIFIHPIETMTAVNEVAETIPRLAEFEGMRKKGADPQEAIFEASDVTTNFNRSGEVGRDINHILRFSNAAVQGLDKEIRTFTTGGKKNILKYIMRYMMSALLSTALLEFWNRINDEDGYEELSAYQKNNFYCISYGDGKFIKIPKAREVAIINSLMERVVDLAFGDKDAFYQFGEYIGDTILPPWLPITGLIDDGAEGALHQVAGSSLLSGIADNAVNEDFKGTPIVSSTYENTPKKQQVNNKTTWIAYGLGQILNESPLKIDHLIDSYTGIIGDLNRAYGAMDKKQIDWSGGLTSTFTADSAYSTDVLNKVYDRRDKTKEKYQNSPTGENACLYEKYAMTASYITKSNKLIKSLPDEEQREARQNLLKEIKSMDMSLSDADKTIAKSFDGDVDDDYFVTTMPKEELSYTKNGKSYSYTMTYEEYSQYIQDYRDELSKLRQQTVNKSNYRSASNTEKAALLKETNSEAAQNVKERYTTKFKSKFQRDE